MLEEKIHRVDTQATPESQEQQIRRNEHHLSEVQVVQLQFVESLFTYRPFPFDDSV